MRHQRAIPYLLFILFLTACSPRAVVNLTSSRPRNWDVESVALLEEETAPPANAEKLGEVFVDDARLFVWKDEPIVIHAAAEQVWMSGGNVLHITWRHKPKPISWNDRSRIKGDILYVPDPDSIRTDNFLQVWQSALPLQKKTWELSLGISGMPLYAYELKPLGYEYSLEAPMSASGLYRNSFYATTSGMVSLQAVWQFHQRWAAISSIGYSHLDMKRVRPSTQEVVFHGGEEIFTAFAGIRFYFVSRPAFKLYTAAQGGLFLHFGNTDYWEFLHNPDRLLGGQFTFYGMQFGRKWFAEVEFYGIGDYYCTTLPGLGGHIGFGYRF